MIFLVHEFISRERSCRKQQVVTRLCQGYVVYIWEGFSADELAGKYQENQQLHRTSKKPLAPAQYRLCLLHDNSVITCKLYHTLVGALHNNAIEEYIIKKAKWNRSAFQLVHWAGHKRALKRLPRFHQHSTEKNDSWLIQY